MRLEDLQRTMIAAIDQGPDHIVEAAFAGGHASAIRGLSVHANTISHARLVAIEDTFPRTRDLIGESDFNVLSRDYLETPGISAEGHSHIGRQFPHFLKEAKLGDAAALATFEWAWLESHHAAEEAVLELAGLAGLAENELLGTVVTRHKAARIVPAFRNEVLESEVPGLCAAAAILVTRPAADVLVQPATALMSRQFHMLGSSQTICNLLECAGEEAAEDSLNAFYAMLEAGVIVLDT